MKADREYSDLLRDSLQSLQERRAPRFDAIWARAEARYRRMTSRYRRFAVAAAVAAVVVTVYLAEPRNGVYLTEQELLTSTQWLAPSDALLPQREFDIYGELPVLIESRDFDEGLPL